jgi:N-acetylmuramoyl-L-alanine amidase
MAVLHKSRGTADTWLLECDNSMKAVRVLLVAAVLAVAGTALAALPVTMIDGRPYIDLKRVAVTLSASLDAPASTPRAYLRTNGHVVALTRNWAQVLVDGRPVVLDGPVQVRDAAWLVPQSFMSQVAPQLTATARGAVNAPSALPNAAARERTEVTLAELRMRSYPSFTRIVLETSAPVEHRVDGTTGKEARVVVLGLTTTARVEEVHDGLVDAVKVERAGANTTVRVGLEAAGATVRTTALVDPPRLLIDVVRPEERDRERTERGAPLRTIVLDAGHGGHDPGAQGPTGLQEKELALDVTRRVARYLTDKLDVKIRLSRDGDYFVPLRDRTSFANKERADLFVSIHGNAHREAANEGVETYFLSSEATDSAARHVAATENSVVQLETPASRGKMDVVKTILWDLAQSQFQLDSSRLAETVQDALTRMLRIPSRGVKQAGFYVLGGAAMPAVLVEIGFVTNPREEKKLKDPRYRDDLARAIAEGLAEYKRLAEPRASSAPELPRRTTGVAR